MSSDLYAVWNEFYIIHTASHTEYHSPFVANTANNTANTVKSRQFELGQTEVLGNSNILKSPCKILIISIQQYGLIQC